MVKMGFPEPVVKMALENAQDNPQKALDFLLQMQGEGNIDELLTNLAVTASANKETATTSDGVNEGASTSSSRKVEESDEAYDRFVEDLEFVEEDHLDIPLDEEEKLILQYMSLLENRTLK